MLETVLKVSDFVGRNDMITRGDTVLACVSGGTDSMALLMMLTQMSGTLGFTLEAIHYNHHLRGDESERDERFVRDKCEEYEIALHVGGGDVREAARRNKTGIEETARNMRYAFFYETAAKIGAQRIATAHNADDNLETVIMSLTRGAGTRGMSGIPPVRDKLIRPLLCLTRAEIEEYNAENNVTHIEDSSNDSDEFVRNRLRHSVIPVLREMNPRVSERVLTTSQILREDDWYFTAMASGIIGETDGGFTVAVKDLRELPHPAFSRAAQTVCYGALSTRHIDELYAFCARESPSGQLDLPGVTAIREYENVIFRKNSVEDEIRAFAPVTLPETGVITTQGLNLKIICAQVTAESIVNKTFTSFLFKNDKVCGRIVVRPREEGDSICLHSRGCTKSLKKLFIENRVPERRRGLVPVIADDNGVLGVFGVGQDERAFPEVGERATLIKFEGIGSCDEA
jgi:tRNA(Ile)-lysidine synthase